MTLSREQAQSLTRTIHLLRTAWSEAGIMAALTQVKHLDAFEVSLAALRAAADKSAQTPGVIPAHNASHWNELPPAPTKQPHLSREERRKRTCETCGRMDGCAPPKHPFVPLDRAPRGRTEAPADLRAHIQPTVTFEHQESA